MVIMRKFCLFLFLFLSIIVHNFLIIESLHSPKKFFNNDGEEVEDIEEIMDSSPTVSSSFPLVTFEPDYAVGDIEAELYGLDIDKEKKETETKLTLIDRTDRWGKLQKTEKTESRPKTLEKRSLDLAVKKGKGSGKVKEEKELKEKKEVDLGKEERILESNSGFIYYKILSFLYGEDVSPLLSQSQGQTKQLRQHDDLGQLYLKQVSLHLNKRLSSWNIVHTDMLRKKKRIKDKIHLAFANKILAHDDPTPRDIRNLEKVQVPLSQFFKDYRKKKMKDYYQRMIFRTNDDDDNENDSDDSMKEEYFGGIGKKSMIDKGNSGLSHLDRHQEDEMDMKSLDADVGERIDRHRHMTKKKTTSRTQLTMGVDKEFHHYHSRRSPFLDVDPLDSLPFMSKPITSDMINEMYHLWNIKMKEKYSSSVNLHVGSHSPLPLRHLSPPPTTSINEPLPPLTLTLTMITDTMSNIALDLDDLLITGVIDILLSINILSYRYTLKEILLICHYEKLRYIMNQIR